MKKRVKYSSRTWQRQWNPSFSKHFTQNFSVGANSWSKSSTEHSYFTAVLKVRLVPGLRDNFGTSVFCGTRESFNVSTQASIGLAGEWWLTCLCIPSQFGFLFYFIINIFVITNFECSPSFCLWPPSSSLLVILKHLFPLLLIEVSKFLLLVLWFEILLSWPSVVI